MIDDATLRAALAHPLEGVALPRLGAFYEGKVAKWWIPDDVIFVDDLPHTATGKLSKLQLRERLRDYRLPGA